jgi:hypothetical protein
MTSLARTWLATALLAAASTLTAPLQAEDPGSEEGAAPSITSALEMTVEAGTELIYQITADNNPALFGAAVNEPGVVVAGFNALTGALRVTVPADFAADTFSMTISAENDHGEDVQTVLVTVTSDGGEPGTAPSITSALEITAEAGTDLLYQIKADNIPTLFGAEVTEPGVVVADFNALTGALRVTVPAGFAAETFLMTISAKNDHGDDVQTVLVTVTSDGGEEGEAPLITSELSIDAVAGTQLIYQITADNDPTLFGAEVDEPGVNVTSFNALTGELRLFITRTFAGDMFTIAIFAENADGIDEQTVEVFVEAGEDGGDGEPGPAQVFRGSVKVAAPTVNALEWQVLSAFTFKGTLHTEGEEKAGRQPGTFSAAITTQRISNRDILEEMKKNGALETVAGTRLVMVGYLGDDTAELTAVNPKEEIFQPVPEDIFAVRFGEEEQRITGYAGKEIEEEPVITKAGGFEQVVVDWLRQPGSTTHVRLTGIGRFEAKRKSVSIEGERNIYNALTRSAAVSGFNSGQPWVEDLE